MVVIDKSDVVVGSINVDMNYDDRGGCDDRDSNNDLMMVMIDLKNALGDGWGGVPKVEIEELLRLLTRGG